MNRYAIQVFLIRKFEYKIYPTYEELNNTHILINNFYSPIQILIHFEIKYRKIYFI